MEFRRSMAHKSWITIRATHVNRTTVPRGVTDETAGKRVVSVHRKASNDDVCKSNSIRAVRGMYVGQGLMHLASD